MSNGDRDGHTKTRLIAGGIVLAILISTVAIGWGRVQSSQYERQAHYQTAHYAAYADRKIEKTCFGLPPIEQYECAAKARHEQRDYQRDELDLVAQRQSALWAYIMGAAAVIGMGLSVVGVILVWTTFAETKQANVIARKAALDSERDAKSSRDAVVLAQRAIVAILRVTLDPTESASRFKCTFDVLNKGQSNAHKIRIDYSMVERPFVPDQLRYLETMPTIFPPNNRIDLPTFVIRAPKAFPSYLVGVLTYCTVHEALFKTYFCLKVTDAPYLDPDGQIRSRVLEEVASQSLVRST